MTPHEEKWVNHLITYGSPELMTVEQIDFLTMLAVEMRDTLLSLKETKALQTLCEVYLGRYPDKNIPRPKRFNGKSVKAKPDRGRYGTDGTRPDGTGNGNNVPQIVRL